MYKMNGENMQDKVNTQVEYLDPAIARQAAREFASALKETPVYQGLLAADKILEKDENAEAALNAYNEKVRDLQAAANTRQVTQEEEAELGELRMKYLHNPSVIEYARVQMELREICQQVGDLLSKETGLDFGASACGGGCCG
jgi:cell fate (sporulation/competence/biofilm development) regulator YlbF (YheA/YmcA/DUF963 family)